tara:strand:+ start:2750 stop:3001 length:252 start_codon:yes stop_codon:yes gene_type:complete
MIEIYGKSNCGYCEKAKALCEMRNLKYNYYQLDTEFTREELLEMFPSAKTFPQIKVNGNAIGGYDRLGSYLEETGYNGTGWSL